MTKPRRGHGRQIGLAIQPAPMPSALQTDAGKLSERARILIHHMLDVHEPAASIARAVARATHEKISPAAISRHAKTYAAKVQAKEDARQRAQHLVGEMIQHGAEVSEMLRAAFYEAFAFAKRSGALSEMNPLVLEAAERKRRELDLKIERDRRELGVKERQMRVVERRAHAFEQRLKLDRAKAQAAVSKLDRKAKTGESLTPEDVQQMREIYGLFDNAEGEDSMSRD